MPKATQTRGNRFARTKPLNAFGAAIRIFLGRRGMTRTDLIKNAQITQAALYTWETSERRPRADVLARIASVLGVTSTALLSPSGMISSDDPLDADRLREQWQRPLWGAQRAIVAADEQPYPIAAVRRFRASLRSIDLFRELELLDEALARNAASNDAASERQIRVRAHAFGEQLYALISMLHMAKDSSLHFLNADEKNPIDEP
jgi:transcriptional regulator with XRE-family HTH domain